MNVMNLSVVFNNSKRSWIVSMRSSCFLLSPMCNDSHPHSWRAGVQPGLLLERSSWWMTLAAAVKWLKSLPHNETRG